MGSKHTKEDPLPELIIWHIWECLARGLCVLAHGNEELDGPNHKSWLRPIGHFDLKPDNSRLN